MVLECDAKTKFYHITVINLGTQYMNKGVPVRENSLTLLRVAF